MSGVLVVTRNPAIAMGLQRHGHDVTDVRPDRYGEWTESAATFDAVVLELPDAVAAEAAVQRLRRGRVGVPVLLVSNTSPGWETVAGHVGPGTQVLPLPISLPGLLASLEALIAAGPVEVPEYVEPEPVHVAPVLPEPVAPEPVAPDPVGAAPVAPEPVAPEPVGAAPVAPEPVGAADAPPEAEEQLFSAVAASIGMTLTESGTLMTGPTSLPSFGSPAAPDVAGPNAEPGPAEPAPGQAAPDVAPGPGAEAAGAAEPAGHIEAAPDAAAYPEPVAPTEAAAAAAADPEPQRGPEPQAERRPAAVAPASESAPAPSSQPRGGRHAAAGPPVVPREGGVVALVDALTSRARELNSVADCAEVAVEELADRVGAEATACLVPDGDEWRVAGGTGLRPLETRLRLPAGHWLVQTVVDGGRGLAVDDTDAAREPLHGAPLASWRNVLAVPIPGVRGMLVAARAGQPFDERAIDTAVAVSREAAPLLAEAVAARELARTLLPLADLDE